jgi:phosphatidylglycerophosphatase A
MTEPNAAKSQNTDQQTQRQQLRQLAWRNPAGWLALGFGSGLSPIAPGTAGSAMALALAWLWLHGFAWLEWPLLWPSLGMIALVFVLGVLAADVVCNRLKTHDHGAVVVDEFVGQWLVLLVAPVSIAGWLAAFLLFRLFDIIKPWPARAADRNIHGGIGVMLDDVFAAAYAMLVLLAYQQLMG